MADQATTAVVRFKYTDLERITDNFNNSRIIGKGGFGEVYIAHIHGGVKVAVKRLKKASILSI